MKRYTRREDMRYKDTVEFVKVSELRELLETALSLDQKKAVTRGGGSVLVLAGRMEFCKELLAELDGEKP